MASGTRLGEDFDCGLNVVIKDDHFNSERSLGSERQIVCAQHGCSPEGVQVPRVRTMKNKTLAEANCGRVTDRGEEG